MSVSDTLVGDDLSVHVDDAFSWADGLFDTTFDWLTWIDQDLSP